MRRTIRTLTGIAESSSAAPSTCRTEHCLPGSSPGVGTDGGMAGAHDLAAEPPRIAWHACQTGPDDGARAEELDRAGARSEGTSTVPLRLCARPRGPTITVAMSPSSRPPTARTAASARC